MACALILLARTSFAAQAPDRLPKWQIYLNAAEKELDSGNPEKAIRNYSAGLDWVRGERRKFGIGLIGGYDEMPKDVEARTSLALASLFGEIAQNSGNRLRQQEADAAFREAIELAQPYPDLRFRARNEFAVFLLKTGHLREAATLLDSMRSESEVQDPAAVSRYEFNFGQLLMQNDNVVEALDHYITAFKADPGFRPAADALLRAARKAPTPPLGIWAVWDLANQSLDELDTIGAAEYLRAGLERTDWWQADQFSNLLDLLVRLFLTVDLDAAGFQAEWAQAVEAIAQGSAQGSAQRAQAIARAYQHDLRACLDDPREAVSKYLPWTAKLPEAQRLEEARLFSEFLSMLADQQFKAGNASFALDRYLVATCLHPDDTPDDTTDDTNVSLHLANLLRQEPDLWTVIESGKTSPDIYASLGRGFAALGDGGSATAAFVRAAGASKSWQDIMKNIKQAVQFSPDQRSILLLTQEDLIARLETKSDQITVTGGAVYANRVAVAALAGVPNSRGSLSLASLVVPNAFASHLSLTDSQGGQGNAISFAGGSPRSNVLSIDSVVVEGPPEPETSTSYYDIDALDSLDVVGGGTDTSLGSNGLHVNFVTKNPGNEWSGSTSYLLLPNASRDGRRTSGIDFASEQPAAETDRLRNNEEYSLQLGGPLKKNRLRAWGSYGESEVGASALGGGRFQSHLSDTAAKLNGSLTHSDQLSLFFNHASRQDSGFGAGLTRAPETTLNREGQSDAWRLDYERNVREWTVSAQYSRTQGDSSQLPQSVAGSEMILGSDGVWQGSFRRDRFQSRANQWQFSTTYSPAAPGAKWSLKAGGSLHQIESIAQSSFGHANSLFIARENLGDSFDVARFYRTGRVGVDTVQAASWLQDTVRFRRLTFDFGLRYDLQEAENQDSAAEANPALSDLLPAVHAGSGSGRISWESLSPRIGATYGLKPNTLLRASYAWFASPIQLEYVQRANAAAPAYVQFGYDDTNGNGVLDLPERGSLRYLISSGVDSRRPQAGSPNVNAAGLDPEITREIILAVETGSPDAKLDLSATWRHVSGVLELRTFVDDDGLTRFATREDFVQAGSVTVVLPDGRQSSVDVFTLDPRLAYTGGSLLTNGDREQEYFGLKLNFVTQPVSRVKLRGVLAYERSNWDIGPRFRFFDDPTNLTQSLDPGGLSRADDSGDTVAVQSSRTGNAKSSPLSSRGSANLNGTFELPFRFLLGTNINFHQGYDLPYFATVLAADGKERDVQVTRRSSSFRLPDLFVVDLRLQQTFTIRKLAATFSLESFNLFNRSTPLHRIQQLNGPQADFLAKTLSPRTVRLGLRLAWGS